MAAPTHIILSSRAEKINLEPMSPEYIVNESHQKTKVNLEHEKRE
jgi:hypothetical protein